MTVVDRWHKLYDTCLVRLKIRAFFVLIKHFIGDFENGKKCGANYLHKILTNIRKCLF